MRLPDNKTLPGGLSTIQKCSFALPPLKKKFPKHYSFTLSATVATSRCRFVNSEASTRYRGPKAQEAWRRLRCTGSGWYKRAAATGGQIANDYAEIHFEEL